MMTPRSIVRTELEREELPWIDIYFESKTRSNPTVEAWSKKVMSVAGDSKRLG